MHLYSHTVTCPKGAMIGAVKGSCRPKPHYQSERRAIIERASTFRDTTTYTNHTYYDDHDERL
jgi:hypothetical protein